MFERIFEKILIYAFYFQIHRVQQRVTIKKALTLKYGEELARAKAVASKELGKRKLEQDRLGVSCLQEYFWKQGFFFFFFFCGTSKRCIKLIPTLLQLQRADYIIIQSMQSRVCF